jgi:hypothetical protein
LRRRPASGNIALFLGGFTVSTPAYRNATTIWEGMRFQGILHPLNAAYSHTEAEQVLQLVSHVARIE